MRITLFFLILALLPQPSAASQGKITWKDVMGKWLAEDVECNEDANYLQINQKSIHGHEYSCKISSGRIVSSDTIAVHADCTVEGDEVYRYFKIKLLDGVLKLEFEDREKNNSKIIHTYRNNYKKYVCVNAGDILQRLAGSGVRKKDRSSLGYREDQVSTRVQNIDWISLDTIKTSNCKYWYVTLAPHANVVDRTWGCPRLRIRTGETATHSVTGIEIGLQEGGTVDIQGADNQAFSSPEIFGSYSLISADGLTSNGHPFLSSFGRCVIIRQGVAITEVECRVFGLDEGAVFEARLRTGVRSGTGHNNRAPAESANYSY